MLGQQVGNYRIRKKLDEGGMGQVYLTEHVEIDARAVVKVLRPHVAHDPKIARRFLNEARAATRIRHPGIVTVFDVGRLDGDRLFILMEFLDGESLGQRLETVGALPAATAVAFLRQAARALGAAHAKRIVHRDLKPGNMFLVPDPDVAGGERIKLLDFGIAKLMAGEHGVVTDGNRRLPDTPSLVLLGTPAYMSPEQCQGAGKVDHRTDLYALGVILFEMLCGRRPFREQTVGDYIAAHLSKQPPRVRMLEPEVPAGVEAVVDRLLAKDPDERYASTRELIAALDEAMRPAGSVKPGATDVMPVLPAMEEGPEVAAVPAADSDADRAAGALADTVRESRVRDEAVVRGSLGGARPAAAGGREVATTLQGSSSELDSRRSGTAPRRKPSVGTWWAVGGGLGVAIVAVLAYVVWPGRENGAGKTEVVNPPVADAQPVAREQNLADDCQGGDKDACATLADELSQTEPARAAGVYEKACELGDGRSCHVRATWYVEGKGGAGEHATPDMASAVRLDESACALSVVVSCERAAGALLQGAPGLDKDEARALKLYERACSPGNSGAACRIAGNMFAGGYGTAGGAKDPDRARQLYTDAAALLGEQCNDAHDGFACEDLAHLHGRGLGVPVNTTKQRSLNQQAARLHQAACDRGEGADCERLAKMYELGYGVNKSQARADEIRNKACKQLEYAASCK